MNYKYALFLLTSACAANSLQAETHFSKTFLMPQYHTVGSAEQLEFWKNLHKNRIDKFSVNLHTANPEKNNNFYMGTSLFYQESVNDADLGSYFGFDKTNLVTIANGVRNAFAPNSFIHTPDVSTLSGAFSLNPKRSVIGTNISCNYARTFHDHQWFLSLNLPIARVEHDLRTKVNNQIPETIEGKAVGVLDFFKGDFFQTTATRVQDALKFAKFGGKKTRTGIPSIDVLLGFEAVATEDYALRLTGFSSIATGNKATGEFLFEPMLGNGRHSSLGAGFEAMLNLYKAEHFAINFFTAAATSYLFSQTEVRTLGLVEFFNLSEVLFAHYTLAAKLGGNKVFPVANISTIPVIVSPGAKHEGMLKLIFAWDTFDLTLGYKMYAAAAESLQVKSFEENVYAAAPDDYDTSTPFTATANNLFRISNLNTASAATPAQLTHTLVTSWAYKPTICNNPLTVALQTKYEFAHDNAAFETFEVGLNLGVQF